MKNFEEELEFLWSNYRVEPQYMQMTLGLLRSMDHREFKPYVTGFLEQTKDLPDAAVAVLLPNSIALLADSDGKLLEFGQGEQDEKPL